MSVPLARRPSSAFHTHVGVVRSLNEDSFLDAPESGVWLVADGMGGESQGDLASRSVVDAMAQAQLAGDLTARAQRAAEILHRVNGELQAEAERHGDGRRIATTVACLLGFDDGRCVCLWAGDSRIYRWRAGRLEQLTRDHSQVQSLVDEHVIDPEQAAVHSMRHVITRAVGALPELELDQRLDRAEPDDLFLLCSDGLHGLVSDGELERMLADGSPEELARALVHLAVSRGAPDNVTVGIVQP